MSRSRFVTRQRLVQAIYQWHLNPQEADEIGSQFVCDEKRMRGVDKVFFLRQLLTVITEMDSISASIQSRLVRSSYHMGAVERAVLSVAACELLYDSSIPVKIVIDQALETARSFGCDHSLGFINAVLDGIAKNRQPPVDNSV